MSITGLVSFKPLKSGKIAVLMEVEATKGNLMALTEMYGETASLLSEQEFAGLPQDRFFLLLDIQARCQKVQDLIMAELHPIPTPLTTSDLLGASMYVPPGPYERDPIVAADEFEPTQPVGVEIMGEKEAEDAD